MVPFLFKIDIGGIHMAVALMSQDRMVQLQIDVLRFEIWCLRTVVFLLISRLVDIITKEQ